MFNLQESATHYFNGSTFDTFPYGNSQASNAGGQFLFIVVDPEFKTITAKNWSPYFEADGDPSVVDPTAFPITPSAIYNKTFTFDFDARFP
jgi:hypothetical protein